MEYDVQINVAVVKASNVCCLTMNVIHKGTLRREYIRKDPHPDYRAL